MMKIEYTKEELVNIIENVRAVENSDDLPIYTWARAAKVLEALAANRKELLKEVEWSATIPHHIPACPICHRSQEDGHAKNCKLAEEVDK